MNLYWLGRATSYAVCKVFGRLEVEGLEKLPVEGAAILAPNHNSYIDPPSVGAAIKRPIWFMAKSELFEVPVLGPILSIANTFPVRRGTADRGALRRAIKLLGEGEMVVMFPEGTRNPTGILGAPELGVALVALKSRAPVYPVAVIGAETVLPQHSALLRFGKIRVRIGDPVPLDDLYAVREDKQVLLEVGNRVMDSLAQLAGYRRDGEVLGASAEC